MLQRFFCVLLLPALSSSGFSCPAYILHEAAIKGNLEKVRGILTLHPESINRRSNWMLDTPLHSVVKSGQLAMVQLLVQHGQATGAFNINRGNSFKKTAMHVAASGGYLDIVEYLHRMGASLDAVDKILRMPLHDAAHMGRTAVVRYLTTQIAERHQRSRHSGTVENFLNWQDKYGRTALHMAAFRGQLDTVKFLVTAGATLNINGTLGNQLCEAVVRKKLSVAEFLIIQGTEIGCKRTEVLLAEHLPNWQALRTILPQTLEELCSSTRLPKDLNKLILEHLSSFWGHDHEQLKNIV